MGLNLVTTGLGSYLASALVNVVNAVTSPSEYNILYRSSHVKTQTNSQSKPIPEQKHFQRAVFLNQMTNFRTMRTAL